MAKPRQESDQGPRGPAVALAILGFLVAFRPVADMDYHWHLAQGRALLAGELPADGDLFSHLPIEGRPTLQAWAADALFALLDRLGGTTLVVLLIAAVVGLSWSLAFLVGHRRCGSPAGGFLVAAFFAAASLLRVRARPEVFSLLLPWVLLLVLDGRASLRRLLLLAGLEAVWINLHPGGLLGPLLALALVPGPGWRPRALLAAAVLAGSCCHPDGPAMLGLFAGETADLSSLIPEWQSLVALDAARFIPEWILVVAGLALVLLALPRWRQLDPGRILVAALGLALAARAVRFLGWISFAVLAAVEARREDLQRHPAWRRGAWILAALLLLGWPLRDRVEAGRAAAASNLSPFASLYTPNYPVAAADYLERIDLRGHLFHPPAWGGYLAARLHPAYRTAHDGRVNLYGQELAARLLRFGEEGERQRLVAELGLEILILPPASLPPAVQADPRHRDDPKRRWLRLPVTGAAEVFLDLRGPNAPHNLAVLRRRR